MITVPYAEAVNHDPLEAAKPLLLLGWTTPAALVARVALEQCVQSLIGRFGVPCRRDRPTVSCMVIDLDRNGVITNSLAGRLLKTSGKLNYAAHGEVVSMMTAVELIEAVERHIDDLRSIEEVARA